MKSQSLYDSCSLSLSLTDERKKYEFFILSSLFVNGAYLYAIRSQSSDIISYLINIQSWLSRYLPLPVGSSEAILLNLRCS